MTREQRALARSYQRRIAAIMERMQEREDASGLTDELLELQAELRDLERE